MHRYYCEEKCHILDQSCFPKFWKMMIFPDVMKQLFITGHDTFIIFELIIAWFIHLKTFIVENCSFISWWISKLQTLQCRKSKLHFGSVNRVDSYLKSLEKIVKLGWCRRWWCLHLSECKIYVIMLDLKILKWWKIYLPLFANKKR